MGFFDLFSANSVDRTLSPPILKQGRAARVIFFYPGEEGTYVDNADVTLYANGIVVISTPLEESTTDLRNCEILWRYETDADDRMSGSKVRLIKSALERDKSRPDVAKDPSKDPSPNV